jgi:hypothetical protein
VVTGTSRSSVIASLVSIPLRLSDIRHVLMADCNGAPARTCRPRLTGEVLSICEAPERVRPAVAWAG